jgi:hypothetical protein
MYHMIKEGERSFGVHTIFGKFSRDFFEKKKSANFFTNEMTGTTKSGTTY